MMKKAYVERDISWMYFNHRILQEAEKEYVPLLERLSFLGIYSNNLDEFFRKELHFIDGDTDYLVLEDSKKKAEVADKKADASEKKTDKKVETSEKKTDKKVETSEKKAKKEPAKVK